MSKRVRTLFGTDGVRGVANAELTPELCLYLGRAAGAYLTEAGRRRRGRARLLVGCDTRLSSPMLRAALVAGANSVGVDCTLAGVIPTPGVAYLTRSQSFDAGVMISASHNPIEDNGVKFFSRDGYKLSDDEEAAIEEHVRSMQAGRDPFPRPTGVDVGAQAERPELLDVYARFLTEAVPVDLQGMRLVVDCGNGAAAPLAPALFRALGADVIALNTELNGARINVACGSTHPEVAQRAVVEYGAEAGLSFDGDADRVVAIDETGQIVNGDHILTALGVDLLRRGELPRRTIAATHYSNGGLRIALEERGGHVLFTPAGDRYVLEAMRREGLLLGGEQSGHIILLAHNTTGDGLLTALALLDVARREGAALSELRALMRPLPQELVSVRVRQKEGWEKRPRIAAAVEQARERLGKEGRIFVRASGTEPVIRVMGEGIDAGTVAEAVAAVARAIEEELGA